MTTTSRVLHMGRGSKLVPIDTTSVPIGARVLQAHRHERGTVVGVTDHGYEVIFEDGDSSGSQQVGDLSPFTRITVLEDEAPADAAEIHDLKELRDQKRVADRLAREEASRKHAEEVTRLTAELREKYPWATGTENISHHARAAKNVREELKRAFPGVKFSVRAESYSGGDSIDVGWNDGPSSEAVKTITDKYVQGSFNGMEDIYEYDRSAYSSAVSTVLGQIRHLFTHRNTDAIDALIEADLPNFIGFADCEHEYEKRERIRHVVNDIVRETSLPIGFVYSGLEYPPPEPCPTCTEFAGIRDQDGWETLALTVNDRNEQGTLDNSPDWILRHLQGNCPGTIQSYHLRLVVPAAPVAPAPAERQEAVSGGGVTVVENAEKNGIELHFASKPDSATLETVKEFRCGAQKWRPAKRNGRWFWYIKASDEARAFARKIAGLEGN